MLLQGDIDRSPDAALRVAFDADVAMRIVAARALQDPTGADRQATIDAIRDEGAARRRAYQEAVDEGIRTAAYESLTADERIYAAARAAGLVAPYAPLAESARIDRLLREGIAAARSVTNLSGTSAVNAVVAEFTAALDSAIVGITSGAMSPTEAVRRATDTVARGTTKVVYITEAGERIESTIYGAVRRAVMTGANQTALAMAEARMLEVGATMVEITAHSGARPEHAEWQGQIMPFSELPERTGYGEVDGLGGANCRHSFFPYFEGIMEPTDWSWADDSEEAYDLSQRQRTAERNIRRYQARANIYRSVGDSASAEHNAALAKKWRAEADAVASKRGGARRRDREVGRITEA